MSTAEQPKMTANEFECVTPILRVENVEASVAYYVDVMGFKVDWQVKGFASVGRDRCHLMLAEGEQGHPGTWVWVGVEDAGRLYEEYKAKGAKIRHPPTNYEWAYELQVFDRDGHVLRLGSEPKKDEPFGPWLDENGVLWQKQADGSFQKVEKK